MNLFAVGLLSWRFTALTRNQEKFPVEMTSREGHYRLERGEYQRTRKIMDHLVEALRRKPKLAKGPGFVYRLLHNIPQKPPTIADRLCYLENELKKAPEKRVLRVPKIDKKQPMNTQRRFL